MAEKVKYCSELLRELEILISKKQKWSLNCDKYLDIKLFEYKNNVECCFEVKSDIVLGPGADINLDYLVDYSIYIEPEFDKELRSSTLICFNSLMNDFDKNYFINDEKFSKYFSSIYFKNQSKDVAKGFFFGYDQIPLLPEEDRTFDKYLLHNSNQLQGTFVIPKGMILGFSVPITKSEYYEIIGETNKYPKK